ncbi:MAG: extracellular solute-binding protein [Verrucomicrobiota bacterium]|jgi:lactose/L-arabinose transport system substrate-binding protein|nr:extracellular solute-binding protein [Verrucomicrobiota bacterium]|tara:strand:+ start:347 stop:1624 length:1278 start_codon:yes stop_codon:yes gene_type:complete
MKLKVAFLRSIILGLVFVGSLQAKPLDIWISSFQDQLYYENMVKLYKESVDKDFEAKVQAFGFREMPEKLAVSIKTGINPPDVVQLDEVLFGAFLAGDVPFLDLDGRLKKAKLDKDIAKSRQKLFAYKGKTYGVPQSLSAMVLYYRSDLLKELDIDPSSLTTWDKLVSIGEKVVKDHGKAMIALDPTYFGILLRQRGSDLFGKDGSVYPDREAAIEVLTWLQNLKKSGVGMVPERASIFDPLFFNSAVQFGEVLTVVGADWYGLDMLQQFTPDLKGKWGAMPLPAWKLPNGKLSRRTSTFAGQGLMINKGSKQPEEAWKFIKFVITNKESNARRFLDGNSFPAYQPAWKDERLLQPNEFFSNQRFGELLVKLSSEVPEVVGHPNRAKAIFLFQETFFNSLIYGELKPVEVIDKMKTMLEAAEPGF